MIRSRLLLSVIFILLSSYKLAHAQYGGGYGGDAGGHGGKDDTTSAIPLTDATTSAIPPTSTAGSGGTTANDSSGLTGDSQCPGSRLMCVTATANGSTVTYELQSQDPRMGWMAIGFGNQMAGSPMVIMWPNPDNSITLSQRQADREVMPTPVPSPPRIATVATPLSTLNGGQSKLTFTIDASNIDSSSHIWAFGSVKPNADPGATLQQHLDSGPFNLDLSKPFSPDSRPSPTSPSGSGSINVPLQPYQKTIIAHAAITTFGFLFLLPLGALTARYTRTYSSKWFTGHWILQGVLGGVFVISGSILGFIATKQQGVDSESRHKTIGKVLLALYLLQSALGVFIHSVKIPFGFSRPPQNYIHAILGLATIALALYQVRLGYDHEWPDTTGRGSVSKSINIVWMVWAILLPVLYFGGLAYLPRQLRQEGQEQRSKGYHYRMADLEDKDRRRG